MTGVMNIEKGLKVKVLVLGDSGVGKSSLSHLLCHNEANRNPGYTIGCSVEIKIHDYKVGTPQEQPYCLEVWDIGASNSHTSSRFIFYSGVDGVILVHDMTNRKTLQNLPKWMNEVINQDQSLSVVTVGSENSRSYHDKENYGAFSIPVLMIGTKLDQISGNKMREVTGRSQMIAEDFGCSEIYLNSVEPQSLAPGSGNAVKLTRFFDKVIDHAKPRQVSAKETAWGTSRGGTVRISERNRKYGGNPVPGRYMSSRTAHFD